MTTDTIAALVIRVSELTSELASASDRLRASERRCEALQEKMAGMVPRKKRAGRTDAQKATMRAARQAKLACDPVAMYPAWIATAKRRGNITEVARLEAERDAILNKPKPLTAV